MKPILIDPRTFVPNGTRVMLAQEIRFDGARFHKGQPVTVEMLERLLDFAGTVACRAAG